MISSCDGIASFLHPFTVFLLHDITAIQPNDSRIQSILLLFISILILNYNYNCF
jgi:hypothetical protein